MHPWRARLERWFRPLARRSPLSPDALTILAFLLNLAAAALFAAARVRPILFMVAIPVITIGGLLDAFDGIVAREQNKSSRFGDFLDHLLDRASDMALLAGWMYGARIRPEFALPLLILIALNGYAGTQIEATFGSRSYEGVGRGEFVLALVAIPVLSYVTIVSGFDSFRVAGLSVAEVFAALLALGAIAGIAQRIRLAQSLDRG